MFIMVMQPMWSNLGLILSLFVWYNLVSVWALTGNSKAHPEHCQVCKIERSAKIAAFRCLAGFWIQLQVQFTVICVLWICLLKFTMKTSEWRRLTSVLYLSSKHNSSKSTKHQNDAVDCFYCHLWTYFTIFSSVCSIDSKQVNVCWVYSSIWRHHSPY